MKSARSIRRNLTKSMSFYSLSPLKLGAEVRGIDLKVDPPAEVIKQIKDDVTKHRIIVFRDQGIIEGKRQVEISKWFGELESTFYKHPNSPDPDVFRVSNVPSEGCTNVGRTGWHIDGSFMRNPFSYSLYHIVSVPKLGNTVFLPLTELIEGLTCPQRQRWERLWMVSDRREGIIHPLIYSHPITKKKVLCFHLGMTESFVWNYKTDICTMTSEEETVQILKEIYRECVKNDGALQYSHKWTQGDFIISDNLAVGHEASPQTQFPVSEVGLRVMHRTTVRGKSTPTKEYSIQSVVCTCGKCR
ncbi:alpha-ketoglutarate-dependent taurine dioxygenase-like [Centruroides vittatus]|uniref:alpha-ketoglutarate-dependent taurine dioxygenase-like n=1 Tax=Centruroides vittatus TaxID=120091 RepID=UPI0035101905